MKNSIVKIITTALLVTPLVAHAQFARVEDAVKYRQAAFQMLSAHVSRIGAVVKGEIPFDKSTIEANIAIIEVLSKYVWTAFPVGSDTPLSKSKPDIWKEMDKFKANAEKMQGDVGKLSVAAKSGDAAVLKSAFGSMTQTCKNCHDNYRNR